MTFVKILAFLFHAFLWILTVAIICYLAWGLMTKQKWRKNALNIWRNLSKWVVKKMAIVNVKVEGKKEEKKSEKKDEDYVPLHTPSSTPPSRNEQPTEQHLASIERQLEVIASKIEQLHDIPYQLDFLSDQVQNLEQMVKELNNSCLPINQDHMETPMHMESTKVRRTYYVSSPSKINPVCFFPDDLSDKPDRHLFCIDAIDGEEGEMDVVSDPETAETLLSTLAFQKHIVEVIERVNGVATAIGVVEKGKLIWKDGVWQLIKKIKIKII